MESHERVFNATPAASEPPVRLLIVDDSENDVLLVLHEFRRSHLRTEHLRVQSAAELRDALARGKWDAVICDFSLPGYGAEAALEAVQRSGQDLPFLVIAGALPDQTAVNLMRTGAHDYVLKDNLVRLVPAALREIKEARDRDERRRAERSLRKSQANLAEAQELANLGSWELDLVTNLLTWSDETYRIFEIAPGSFGANYETFLDAVHPEDRQLVDHAYADALKNRTTYQIRHRLRMKDGRIKYVLERGRTEYDLEGRALRSIGTVQDITEQEHAEQRFRNVLEATPDAILIVDASGTIAVINARAEALFGYRREELLGQPLGALIPERFRATHRGRCDGYFEHPWVREHTVGMDLFGLRKDGSEFPADITLSPLRTDAGMLALAAVRDITQRVRMEEQLRQAHKMESVGRLAGGIAHDFNNILAVILGYAELAQAKVGTAAAPRIEQHLEEIHLAAERAKALVQQLLAFSRSGAGAVDVIDAAPIVREVVRMCSATFPSSMTIELKLEAGLPSVRIDAVQLNQALLNLVINARDAMQGRGRIEITASSVRVGQARNCSSCRRDYSGDFVSILVADRGHGIEPAQVGRLFEPFFTTKEAGKGTGLGLAVLHGIVHSAGGHVEARARPGGGSEFSVYLPAGQAGAKHVTARDDAPAMPPRLRGRVMVVDDEPAIVALITEMLEDAGCEVTGFSDATAALREVQARPLEFDLVITDQTMPRLTGEELARAILGLRPDLPVILCTGYADRINADGARALGIRRFFLKPVPKAELLGAVRELLQPPR